LSIAQATLPTLTISGPAGTYRIEGENKVSSAGRWTTLATIAVTNSPHTWTDMQITNSVRRFYRAVLLP
jgi:hypothetical protein